MIQSTQSSSGHPQSERPDNQRRQTSGGQSGSSPVQTAYHGSGLSGGLTGGSSGSSESGLYGENAMGSGAMPQSTGGGRRLGLGGLFGRGRRGRPGGARNQRPRNGPGRPGGGRNRPERPDDGSNGPEGESDNPRRPGPRNRPDGGRGPRNPGNPRDGGDVEGDLDSPNRPPGTPGGSRPPGGGEGGNRPPGAPGGGGRPPGGRNNDNNDNDGNSDGVSDSSYNPRGGFGRQVQSTGNGTTGIASNGAKDPNAGSGNQPVTQSGGSPKGQEGRYGASQPTDSKGWGDYLKTQSGTRSNSSNTSRGPVTTDSKGWSDWVKKAQDGLNVGKAMFDKISGQVSKFLNRLTRNQGDSRATDLTATSGVTDKVGYANPGGRTCYAEAFLKAARGAKSLVDILKNLDGKNVTLGQKPQHVRPEKVGGVDYEKSSAALSKDNKDESVKQFIGGFAGWDGGSINFDKAVNDVTKALGNLSGTKADISKYSKCNNAKGLQAYKNFFNKVADYLSKNPDKKAAVTTYTATHGNVYSKGNKRRDGKEGGGAGSTLGIDEHQYDKLVKDLKARFPCRVAVSDIWDCCHAGGWMPARKV